LTQTSLLMEASSWKTSLLMEDHTGPDTVHTREAVKCCLLDLLGVRLSMWFDLVSPSGMVETPRLQALSLPTFVARNWHLIPAPTQVL
jgi:hypothetical protein